MLDQLELVAAIYEAAAVPENWPRVLERLCEMSGARGGALVALAGSGEARFTVTRSYAAAYQAVVDARLDYNDNPRVERYLDARYDGFTRDLDHCSQDELDADPLYSKGLHGYGWTMGSVIALPTRDVIVFDFGQALERGPYGSETPKLLNPLRPHLARAATLSARLQLRRSSQIVDTLEELGLPAAVVTSSGRVKAHNSLFDRLDERVVIGADDRLLIKDTRLNQLLAGALAVLGRDDVSEPRSVPLRATETNVAQVFHLVPVRGEAHDIFPNADAVLVGLPVTAPEAPLTELLNGLFDLTPAEARLAKSVAAGLTLDEHARQSGVSLHTVRTQLKAVFHKTGTSRQAELVGLLAGTTLGRAPRER